MSMIAGTRSCRAAVRLGEKAMGEGSHAVFQCHPRFQAGFIRWFPDSTTVQACLGSGRSFLRRAEKFRNGGLDSRYRGPKAYTIRFLSCRAESCGGSRYCATSPERMENMAVLLPERSGHADRITVGRLPLLITKTNRPASAAGQARGMPGAHSCHHRSRVQINQEAPAGLGSGYAATCESPPSAISTAPGSKR